jgi:hypothetical protein
MNILRTIKNWVKFQHYQSGPHAKKHPDWIKLYRGLLDDIEWHNLDPLAAKTLVSLWLLASENGGTLPPLKTIAFRLRMPEKQIQSVLSHLPHWIDDTCLDTPADLSRPEEEREKENKNKKADTPLSLLKEVLDDDHAQAVVEHRQRLRKPLTCRASKLLGSELKKAPNPNAAADLMMARGWAGFDVSWLKNGKDPPAFSPREAPRSYREIKAEQEAKQRQT